MNPVWEAIKLFAKFAGVADDIVEAFGNLNPQLRDGPTPLDPIEDEFDRKLREREAEEKGKGSQ